MGLRMRLGYTLGCRMPLGQASGVASDTRVARWSEISGLAMVSAFASGKVGIMLTSTRSLQVLLVAATGAYAQFVFPDCTSGRLSNETICDASACTLIYLLLHRPYNTNLFQHRWLARSLS